MGRSLKVVLAAALVIIIASLGFMGGFVVAKVRPDAFVAIPGATKVDPALEAKIAEVRQLIDEEALVRTTDESLTAGILRGIVESTGDQYGTYFNEKHFGYFNEEMSGEFGGIGVQLTEKDGAAYVVEVYKGTPAEKGGVKAGDVFISIDGDRRDRWTSDEVVKRVRGEKGTNVKLTMLRPGKDGARPSEYTVTLTRATIEFPNVESELIGSTGYISVGQFNERAAEDITAAISELAKKGANSYVLDLRNNPGGSLQEAIDVTSLFVSDAVVVRVEERGKKPIVYETSGPKVTSDPLVVLVNGDSASASEIVAGALQDHGRAKVVGVQTFGKGSVQTIKPLSFGGAIKFTIAHYLTPDGNVIDGKGLKPDVEVVMDAELQMEREKDTQLKKALETVSKGTE